MDEKITVLMIDDEKDIVHFFEKAFAHFKNIRFLTACRAPQGIEIAKKEKPKLILLDLRMPEMNGEEGHYKSHESHYVKERCAMSDDAKKQRKGTILIVDDEANVLWFISKVCQPMGYETLTAGSGMEALKVIQECAEKLDLVLLDLRMPGMGGIEVLKSIRKHQPDLPVIVLTAVHDKQEECEALGIEAFIKKPYSLEELCERIEAVIEKQTFERGELVLEPNMEPCAKILIVDDEKEVCEILADALSEDLIKASFDVRYVTSADEALRESVKFEPDIAIVDIKMPHMSSS